MHPKQAPLHLACWSMINACWCMTEKGRGEQHREEGLDEANDVRAEANKVAKDIEDAENLCLKCAREITKMREGNYENARGKLRRQTDRSPS